MRKRFVPFFLRRLFRTRKMWIALTVCLGLLGSLLGACAAPSPELINEELVVENAVRVSSVEALLQHGLLTGKEEHPESILISYVKPVADGTLLLWNDGTSLRVSLLGEDKNVRQDTSLPDTFIGTPFSVTMTTDGWVILSTATDEYFRTQYYLSKIASDFSPLIASVCLSDLADATVYGFECVDTTAVITSDIGGFFYDLSSDFITVGSLSAELPVFDLTVSGGKLYALQDREHREDGQIDVLLSEVDISSKQLRNTRTILSGTAYADRIFGDKEGFIDTIAFTFSDGLYLYKTDGSSLRKDFSCSINAGGHSIQTIQEIRQNGEGLYRAWGYYNTKMQEYIYDCLVLMDISPRSQEEKETVRIGVLSRDSSPEIYNICEYVNTLNLPFSLELTVYMDPSDPNFDLSQIPAAKLAFLRDALSGNPPDLLILSPQERQVFDAQDALLDLSPYIEDSKTFDPEEFLPNIWSALSSNQTCDWIPPSVYLNGTMVNEENVGELAQGDVEDILTFVENHPDKPLLSAGFAGAFYSLLTTRIDAIYDGVGDQSEEKQALIDLISCMVDLREQSDARGGESAGDIASEYSYLSDFEYYMSLDRSKSGTQAFCGPFGRLDQGPGISADGGLSISAGTKNADLCWSVIEFLLSEEILDVYAGAIPLRQSSFETMLLSDVALVRNNDTQSGVAIEYNDGVEVPSYEKTLDAVIIEKFRKNVYAAKTWSFFDENLCIIIMDELDPCLAGDISPEEGADRLIERVGLYQSERESGSA